MCRVSVVVPAYNHGKYILQTLDSVFAQTYTDYEVIIINDGSPDNTTELLRPLKESGRIRYFEQPNAGQAAARNRGLAEACGEFIAFLDDDDLWPPDKLEWQVQELDRRPACGVIVGVAEGLAGEEGGNRIFGVSPLGLGPNEFKDFTFREMFHGCPFISPGQTLIRAELLRRLKGFRAEYRGTDDFDLWMRAVREARVLQFSRTALYYRWHSGSASRDLQSMLINSHAVVRQHIIHLPPDERNRVVRAAYRFLYDYCGYDLTVGCKERLCSGLLVQFVQQANLLARIFLPHLWLDPLLAGKLVKAIFTGRTHSWKKWANSLLWPRRLKLVLGRLQ
ncbi:MAG: glycosyltransferase family 2 protein [Verrucomicrobia bacterium]|nr:glycosyltransferase family 2 protein [Verrucomicrobiota bacterium]